MKINTFTKNLALSALFLAATATTFAAESTQGTASHYTVKNVHIGEFPVKTIVPITAKTADQAIAQAKVIAANADVDLAEFRIDLLDFAADRKKSSHWVKS